MEELKDYSGPFIRTVTYDDLSKEVLVKLLRGYSEAMNVLNMFWTMAVRKRLGDEATKDTLVEVWRMMGPVEMGCPMKAANIEGKDVETYCKINQLVPSFAQDYYRYEFDVKNKNRAVLTVQECPAYSALQNMGDLEMLDWACHTLELEGMKAYAQVLNPAIQVRELRAGANKKPDEPACQWEFWIEE